MPLEAKLHRAAADLLGQLFVRAILGPVPSRPRAPGPRRRRRRSRHPAPAATSSPHHALPTSSTRAAASTVIDLGPEDYTVLKGGC
jgi:hypothetical protein